jgi:cytochrome c2
MMHGLTLAGAATLALGAVAVARAGDASDGEALFKQKCTSCHPGSKPIAKVRKTAEADRAAYLEKFLPTHFSPDPAQRKAIIDHLLGVAAKE